MLRTATAAVVAVAAISLAGAPAAEARPCYGTGTTCSHDPSYKPGPEQRKIAAHRVADPIVKRITDAINDAVGKVTAPKAQKGAHKAGHPVEDYRIARKRTMDNYFEKRREQTVQKIRDRLNQHR